MKYKVKNKEVIRKLLSERVTSELEVATLNNDASFNPGEYMAENKIDLLSRIKNLSEINQFKDNSFLNSDFIVSGSINNVLNVKPYIIYPNIQYFSDKKSSYVNKFTDNGMEPVKIIYEAKKKYGSISVINSQSSETLFEKELLGADIRLLDDKNFIKNLYEEIYNINKFIAVSKNEKFNNTLKSKTANALLIEKTTKFRDEALYEYNISIISNIITNLKLKKALELKIKDNDERYLSRNHISLLKEVVLTDNDILDEYKKINKQGFGLFFKGSSPSEVFSLNASKYEKFLLKSKIKDSLITKLIELTQSKKEEKE